MEKLEIISKKSPVILLFAIVVSTLANIGFFAAAGSSDLITNLNYQDLITSSILVLAVIFPLFMMLIRLYQSLLIEVPLAMSWRVIVQFTLILSGVLLILNSPYNLMGWLLLIIFGAPLIIKGANYCGLFINKEWNATIVTVFAISMISFTHGYTSFASELCGGSKFIEIEGGEKKQLLKIYSSFLMVRESETSVSIIPNNHDFIIFIDNEYALKNLQSDKCNPIVTWYNKTFHENESQ